MSLLTQVRSTAHAQRGVLAPVTQHRDLRTGASYWAGSRDLVVPTWALHHDTSVDVAVVGAGISGALMAYALLVRGHRVTVFDRRPPLQGSTMASTALLQFELDVPLTILAQRIGRHEAERAWRRSVSAVQALRAIVRRERIRCAFRQRASLYLAGDQYGPDALRAEADARNDARIPGKFLERDALADRFHLKRDGAIESNGCAAADPAKLTAALLRRCIARGARIYSPADVGDIETHGDGVNLALSHGPVVHARHAVFCTGYELLTATPLAGHHVKSTWAIATEPVADLPAWLSKTLVWEASDPYLYLRTTPDGRIIAGGEDEASSTRHTDRELLYTKAASIQRKVAQLLPGLALTISHRWAGAFGESPTGLPIIDAVRGLPHCYSVTGFGGNGITHSVIAAQVIAAALSGVVDKDADLFRAPRADAPHARS